mmetsp:Transcript_34940/g.26075  ORF Transcript_34940/g.26075 Transcript_34940/m.26075 type:complete len:149 (+) Transcript_34940:65-511(+)
MENNATPDIKDEEAEEKEELKKEEWRKQHGYQRDGGLYSKEMEKEISQAISQRLHFPNFNILLYASEYLMKYASNPETSEENRDNIYDLYDMAFKLEPKPEPELTFSQRMLLQRAQMVFTRKMQKRIKFQGQKRNKKVIMKLGNIISG